MKKISFRKFEHMILPHFRQKINEAESTEDIKNIFVSSIKNLFESAFGGAVPVQDEDVRFTPYEEPYFFLSQGLLKNEYIRSIWNDSDLRHVIERLAESAMNRYKHLGKHGEKTDAKIRMNFFR
jgi:hypothetical protein